MRIIGPDHRDYGPIERYDDQAVYVQGKRIPLGAIEHLEQDRAYVSTAALQQFAGSSLADEGLADEGLAETGRVAETRIPIVEERLEVGTREVELGEVRVHKTVEEREEVQRGPLNREEVQVERVRVNRPVSAPEERRQEGDWLIIPIMEEVLVVQKQLMVTEEIRIRKQLVTEEREIRETVRRERATVEDTRQPAPRPSAPPAPASARAASEPDADDPRWNELREEVRGAGRP
jgi:uncharacterized protein (TIGR02271 family)